jgi:hypothetical protein
MTSREQDAFSKGLGAAPTVAKLQEVMNARSRPGVPEGRTDALEILLEDYHNMVMGHRQESTVRAKAAMRNNHRFQRFSIGNQAQDDNFLRPRVHVARIMRPKLSRQAAKTAPEEEAEAGGGVSMGVAGTNHHKKTAAANGGVGGGGGDKKSAWPVEVVHTAVQMSRTTGRGTKVPGATVPGDALCFAVPAPPPVQSFNMARQTPRAQSASTKYRGFLFSADDAILHTRPSSAYFSAKTSSHSIGGRAHAETNNSPARNGS